MKKKKWLENRAFNEFFELLQNEWWNNNAFDDAKILKRLAVIWMGLGVLILRSYFNSFAPSIKFYFFLQSSMKHPRVFQTFEIFFMKSFKVSWTKPYVTVSFQLYVFPRPFLESRRKKHKRAWRINFEFSQVNRGFSGYFTTSFTLC